MTRVLIVEDERPLLRALAMNLTARGNVIRRDPRTISGRAMTVSSWSCRPGYRRARGHGLPVPEGLADAPLRWGQRCRVRLGSTPNCSR